MKNIDFLYGNRDIPDISCTDGLSRQVTVASTHKGARLSCSRCAEFQSSRIFLTR